MRPHEKILWGVIAAFFVCIFLYLIPSYPSICEYDDALKQERCSSYHIPLFIILYSIKTLNYAGAAIAVLGTVAIAWFTFSLKQSTDKLWDAGERQLTQLKTSSERRLRAYVYLENAYFKYDVGDHWAITYKIKNFGQTPAHVVRSVAIARVIDWNDGSPKIPTPGPVEVPLGSMAPGGDCFDNEAVLEGSASYEEIRTGRKAIYLVGSITYADVFQDERRRTSFRYYIGGDVGCDGNEMFADDQGNDAT